MFKYREMNEADNEVVAALVRDNLKQFGLDVPGTVYFDKGLDRLSDYYGNKERRYFVVENETGNVIGGIGFARFEPMQNTAELQKLYLADVAKGFGLGYEMIEFIENKMRDAGYKQSYLETHDNLKAAVHIYEKCGYKEIERPKEVVHSTMNRFFLKTLQKFAKVYRAKGHPRKYRFCSLLLIAGEIVKDYEYMKKLERNLIDNILESEVKLGRTNSSITFYYPEDSLTELLDCSRVELPLKIAAFIENEEDHLDNIIIEELGNEKGRYAVKISEKALDWVHNNYQPSDFMKEFVEEIRKPDKTLEGIAELFRKYSPEVVISKVNTDECAFAFKEDTIDPYVYHIEQNIFGLEYHRFTRQAYEKMMCGINK